MKIDIEVALTLPFSGKQDYTKEAPPSGNENEPPKDN